MHRRHFLQAAAASTGAGWLLSSPASAAPRRIARPVAALDNSLRIAWSRSPGSPWFDALSCDDYPLVFRGSHGVLSAALSLENESGPATRIASASTRVGPLAASLRQELRRVRPTGGEDVLMAEVEVRNPGAEPMAAILHFSTSAHPARSYSAERVHLPLTAGNHSALKELGLGGIQDCDQPAAGSVSHYLEPAASDPRAVTTQRLLVIPLADRSNPAVPWRVALFGSPERAWRFASLNNARGETGWQASTRIIVPANGRLVERFFLFVHAGDAAVAWRAFHQLAHSDPYPAIGWLRDVKVHYFDFLSPGGAGGKRGAGYDLDAPYFGEFSIGLATQHGYYPVWGDYIHPDRKTWMAMPSDANGPAPMSLDKLRERCRAARQGGGKAAIYLHTAGFDPTSREAGRLKDAVLVGADGKPQTSYPWDGPDISAPHAAWFMSMAAPEWRAYLLQQARWVMELVNPDAIVVDETFAGTGYDHHPSRRGVMSPHMIGWLKDLRRLLRGFGPDKALLTSDCTLGSFVLWADAEGGDHAYGGNLLGAELYRRAPVRYLAGLGDKPWLPCAWNTQSLWDNRWTWRAKPAPGSGSAMAGRSSPASRVCRRSSAAGRWRTLRRCEPPVRLVPETP